MKGTALIYVLLTVGIILSIVFFVTSIFASKLHLALDFSNSVVALYAADSAIEWRMYNLFKEPDAVQPSLTNGATFSITAPGVLPVKAVGKYRGASRSLEVSI